MNELRKNLNIALFLIQVIAWMTMPRLLLADEPQLSATLDKQTARVNEEIHLNVKISGVRGSLQAPHLPSLEGFEIFYSGRSSRFSFINGRSESLTEFSYVLIPRSAGRFVLQPIEVKVGNQTYRTNQLEVQIEDNQTVVAQPIQRQQPTRMPLSQMPSLQPTSAPQTMPSSLNQLPVASDGEIDQNIFLKAIPSQTTVYTNQQLVLTYSLYTRYDTRYEGFIEEPETSGFWIEEFPMDQNIGRDTETVSGKRYVRADVKKIALFPTSPGQYQIKPGVVKTSVQIEQPGDPSSLVDEFFNNSFFGGGGLFMKRVEKILSPQPIQILVNPLPEEGKPESFKGAVGDFRMATSVDKRVVNQNEAVTMQIILEGEGNIETLERPTLPDIKGVKTYESDTQTQLFRTRDVIAGKKTYEIVLIPSEVGELSIPSVEFSFFSPKTARYMVVKSDSYKIKVDPSKTPPPAIPKEVIQSGLGEAKKSIRQESEDIQYIQERMSASNRPLISDIIFWLALMNGILSIACLGTGIMRKRSEFLEQNVSLKRKLFAKKYAVQGLKRLNHLAKVSAGTSQSDEVFFEDSAKILNQYLADKLNLSSHGLTQDLIEGRLLNLQIDLEIIQKIRECYEICDRVRFGRMDFSGSDREAMLGRIREIIYAMEK